MKNNKQDFRKMNKICCQIFFFVGFNKIIIKKLTRAFRKSCLKCMTDMWQNMNEKYMIFVSSGKDKDEGHGK